MPVQRTVSGTGSGVGRGAREVLVVLAAAVLGACGPVHAASPARAIQAGDGGAAARVSGQRLAQRYCGQCHAVAKGQSPLPDAPPFRRLFQRYGPGRLDAILAEGMLAPSQWPEEGSPSGHPRMPMARLDDDQVADLKAYLRSLDPRIVSKPNPGGSKRPAGQDPARP